MGSRTICIGDIHGCSAELDALLDRLEPTEGDRFVFLGDLIDRGPDSPGVVRRVRRVLRQFPGSTAILGNHERNLRTNVLMQGREAGSLWLEALSDDELTWLIQLPPFAVDKSRGLLMVHGGLYPRYFEEHGALPADPHAAWTLPSVQRARLLRFCSLHRVDRTGNALPGDRRGGRFWAEHYDGSQGFVCFGHRAFPAPAVFPHALGLDGGCVYGDSLFAAVWSNGRQPLVVEQPANRAYAIPDSL